MTRRRDRSTPSGPGRPAAASETRAAAAREREVAAFVASLLREADGLAAAIDPLDAELIASGVLSMWHADHPADTAALDALARSVFRRLAERPDPDVLALLIAFAVTASPPLDEAAHAAVARLREAKVPEPLWATTIGRPALVDAWISTDQLEDQSHLLAAFAYERRPPHAFNAIIDYNFHGLIRDAFVADDPVKIGREWQAVSGLPIRPLSEQALADVLGQGLEMYDLYLEPPVAEEAHLVMPLLRSRLRLLPEPRPFEDAVTLEEAREQLVEAFAASPEAAGLEPAGERPAADLARWFVDFACDYGAGDPLRWSPIAVEMLFTDWLPGKAILEPSEIAALPEVLRRFVRFSARRKGLGDELIAETLETVDRVAPGLAAGMADDEHVGPAKQIVKELLAAGVDLTDQAALQRWIDARNADLAGGTGGHHRQRRRGT
jgi:GNAT superfamily N-acetyltransferase